jgi:hypothetical protein
MEKIYVTKILLETDSETELDFENREKFGWEDWDKQDYFEIQKNYTDDGQEPIEIDKMIRILQNSKDRLGATHVNVEYHVDHHGYYFSIFKMRKSTQEEINEYENRKKEIVKLDNEINDLHDKMEKLIKLRRKIK